MYAGVTASGTVQGSAGGLSAASCRPTASGGYSVRSIVRKTALTGRSSAIFGVTVSLTSGVKKRFRRCILSIPRPDPFPRVGALIRWALRSPRRLKNCWRSRFSGDLLASEERQRLEHSAQRARGGSPSQCSSTVAYTRRKSKVRLQVAVLKIGQAGSRTDQSAANGTTDQEHRRGGAVVRPVGGVLGDATAELAEDHDHRAVGQTRSLHVGLERPEPPDSSSSISA